MPASSVTGLGKAVWGKLGSSFFFLAMKEFKFSHLLHWVMSSSTSFFPPKFELAFMRKYVFNNTTLKLLNMSKNELWNCSQNVNKSEHQNAKAEVLCLTLANQESKASSPKVRISQKEATSENFTLKTVFTPLYSVLKSERNERIRTYLLTNEHNCNEQCFVST